MLQVLWSQSKVGERPGVLLGEDLILLHYSVGKKSQTTELVCYNIEGQDLWYHTGLSGVVTLPGGRFLVTTLEGEPLIISSSGQILRKWGAGRIERVALHGDLLILASTRQVWAADLELSEIWRLTWPGVSQPAISCYVDNAFYWAEQKEIKFFTSEGESGILCRLPADLISAAMDRYERETGTSALSGWLYSPENPEGKALKMGDRPSYYYWRVSFDPRGQQFFLANATGPHLVLSFDKSGRALWCEYLCCGCCGGVPYTLPDGRYVASSGCGGILSWLDGEGKILFQSRPHEGVGLATAYTSDLRVLPNGRVLADGGPGVIAYNSAGKLLWAHKRDYCRFECDAARGFLVGCYWENEKANRPSRTYLEFVTGL